MFDSSNNPHACSYCCGSTYLRMLENAADADSAGSAVESIAMELAILGERRREYGIKSLADQFGQLLELDIGLADDWLYGEPSPPKPGGSGTPEEQGKSGNPLDFLSHPTHREWAVPNAATAASGGTPCHPEASSCFRVPPVEMGGGGDANGS